MTTFIVIRWHVGSEKKCEYDTIAKQRASIQFTSTVYNVIYIPILLVMKLLVGV